MIYFLLLMKYRFFYSNFFQYYQYYSTLFLHLCQSCEGFILKYFITDIYTAGIQVTDYFYTLIMCIVKKNCNEFSYFNRLPVGILRTHRGRLLYTL